METFSALLALCAGNSSVTGEFLSQRPVTRSLMFSLIWVSTNVWINNREAGDLRCHPLIMTSLQLLTMHAETSTPLWNTVPSAQRIHNHPRATQLIQFENPVFSLSEFPRCRHIINFTWQQKFAKFKTGFSNGACLPLAKTWAIISGTLLSLSSHCTKG